MLSSTLWKVIRKVLDVALEVWNSGKQFGKIPPAILDETEAQRPENMEFDNQAKSIDLEWQKMWLQNKATNHSGAASTTRSRSLVRYVYLSYSMGKTLILFVVLG